MDKNKKTDYKSLPKGITLRSDGRYMGRIKYQGEYFTFYSRNLKDLEQELEDKRYELKHGLYAKKSNLTVEAWFNTWLDEYKKRTIKQGTYTLYKNEFSYYIKDTLGRRKLSDIRPEHVQKLINALSEDYSRQTISLVKNILNGMFKQAVRNGIVLKNPVELVTLPRKEEQDEMRVLSEEEQKIFLEYAKESIYYDAYVTALATGMRNGELRALRWEDLDFENKIIHVRKTLIYIPKRKEKYKLDLPKTSSSVRDIPMLDNISKLLKEHRKKQIEYRMMLGDKWRPQKGFENLVFTGMFGRCISSTAFYYDLGSIERRIQKDKIPFDHIYPHTLRHTFATRGLENGIPPKVMQALLGHTSISMTLDIYSHVLPDTKAKELQKISRLFESAE